MWLTLLAVAVGLASGVVAGGSLRSLGRIKPAGIALAAAWFALTALTRWTEVPNGRLLFFAANICALAFAALNARRLSSWILFIGLALNTVVIGLNGAMPYRVSSVISAGLASVQSDFPETVQTRPERKGDRLTLLGDVLSVKAGFIRDVFSIGDAIAAVGIGWIVFVAASQKQPAAAAPASQTATARPTKRRKSNILLGEDYDLDADDDFEVEHPDDATITHSVTSLIVDLTIDRANNPERYEQATSGLLEPLLAAGRGEPEDDELLDITTGDMPGNTFWHERSVQRSRAARLP
jgi:hypothetical protein